MQDLEFKTSKFVESDQARYTIYMVMNRNGKIKQLRFSYRIYPLLSQGYGNYEELNINMTKLIKYTHIDIYWIRDSWNGSGYFPICSTRFVIDDEFFDFIVGDNNVKEVVLRLFRELKGLIENSGEDNECFYATRYFPV